jgi:hypothetical protein
MSKKTGAAGSAKAGLNGFDRFCVVFLVIAVIGAAGYAALQNADVKKVMVTYTVELSGVDQDLYDLIVVGEELKDNLRTLYLGKIIDKSKTPASVVYWNKEAKQFFETENANKDTVLVTIEAEGQEDDISVSIGEILIKVGRQLYLKGKGYTSAGYIVEMKTE